MNKRWAPAFTIVELIIVIAVLGILVTIITFGYIGVRKSTVEKSIQNDLKRSSIAMEQFLESNHSYPTELPASVKPSTGITLNLGETGAAPYYSNTSAVQNGVLFASICETLIAEGAGRGVNQGGQTEDYIMNCGNWNHDRMQFTAWATKTWPTPVNSEELLEYANTFTTGDNWNKAAHEGVVKHFYTELVNRFERQGGKFPVTTFWDYWATPGNGVMKDPLPLNPRQRPYFCIEATSNSYSDMIWHITQDDKVSEGSC